jgi:DNA invertase Pin-like site-specific DNA recombinase
MKKVYGYIRVSTAKQSNGASLDTQKEDIISYANKNQLNIID